MQLAGARLELALGSASVHRCGRARWCESARWCAWQRTARTGSVSMVAPYLFLLVQRPIDPHPAAGPAAQIPAAGTPEGMAGGMGHQVRGDEPPQPEAHYGKDAPAPRIGSLRLTAYPGPVLQASGEDVGPNRWVAGG
jgi:hypothetical protein